MTELNYQVYEDKCKKLLDEEEIRFAGIINESGKLISGGFKKGIIPLEDDESRLQSFMEFVSKVSIRKEYDKTLGPINYLAARRDKAVLVSFPFPISTRCRADNWHRFPPVGNQRERSSYRHRDSIGPDGIRPCRSRA